MTNQTVPATKSRINIKRALIITEQLALYTVIVGGLGFYAGIQFNQAQSAKTAAAIHDAVQAATPVASVPKSAR